MSLKIYKSNTTLSVPLVRDGKVFARICFDGQNNTFWTSNKMIQDALEASNLFGTLFHLSEIRFEGEDETEEIKNAILEKGPKKDNQKFNGDKITEDTSIKTYDVTDWNQAKDILRGEPFNIDYRKLNTPNAILKHAKQNKVEFPNLKL